jgi:hypothetical protein
MFAGARPDDEVYDRLGRIAKEVSASLGADMLRVCMIAPANDRPNLHDVTAVVLLDTQHEAQRLYGARHDRLYLVRPDGYIGFHGEPALLEPLLDYLGRVFPATIPLLVT